LQIELVPDCRTIKEIQEEMGTGVKAVYEDIVLLNWLRKNNSSEFQYKAVFFL